MARTICLLATAIFTTFIHVCLNIFLTFYVVLICLHFPKNCCQQWDFLIVSYLICYGTLLLTEIAMLVSCFYLIAGIEKERHQYIAPYIYLTILYMILSLLNLMIAYGDGNASFDIKLIIIIIQAVIWLRVLIYWWELEATSNTNLSENSPVNIDYTTVKPGANNKAGLAEFQQNQFVANNYKPTCHRPEMQAGVGCYCAQNKTTGLIQSTTINSQELTSDYTGEIHV